MMNQSQLQNLCQTLNDSVGLNFKVIENGLSTLFPKKGETVIRIMQETNALTVENISQHKIILNFEDGSHTPIWFSSMVDFSNMTDALVSDSFWSEM